MIGTGLTKYAKENGLQVAKGVAYGNFRGYAVSMSEGAGYKQVVFSTKFTQAGDTDALQAELNAVDLPRLYRIQRLSIAPNGILIAFTDNPGTMKKITEFLDWFVPVLSKYSATGYNICTQCGGEITQGRWILVEGVAQFLHESCAAKVKAEIGEAEQAQKEQDTGSYATGTVGAVVGALLGAVVWGIVLCMGYVASLVGLLIGWLSGKGYDLMNGRKDKGKVVILALAVLLGVAAGTVGGYAVSTWMEIESYYSVSLTFAEFMELFVLMLQDGEYMGYIIKDLLLGLVFAALGVFAMLRRTNAEVSGTKVVDLE